MSIKIVPPGPASLSGDAGASVSGHGVVTGPGVGANIVTIAAGNLVLGTSYQLDVYYYLNGTTASPADDDNIRIVFNGATVMILPWDGAITTGGPPLHASIVSPPSNGVGAIQVQAIGAATGTAIYHVTIVATPLAV
jgi:hypothetical protein